MVKILEVYGEGVPYQVIKKPEFKMDLGEGYMRITEVGRCL